MKAKERPLRVGPFEAKKCESCNGFEVIGLAFIGAEAVHVDLRQLPALARLVAKMRAAESRRGKVRR